MAWLISDIHTIIIYLFPEELDYIFYNNTVTFNGSYLVGDSECVTVNVSVADDNLVEGTKVFNVLVRPLSTLISIFIIDNDCKLFSFP